LLSASRRRILLASVAAVVCLAGGSVWYRFHQTNAFFEPHILLSRFPPEEATVLSIDFSLLRHAGLLTDSKVPLESEYKQFLDGTGFDYKRDLDSVFASFSDSGNFFIARGRFDWDRLRAYVNRQGGSCYKDLCRVQGSTPERHISFLPLRKDAIALAVSSNDLAATRLSNTGQRVSAALPTAPVWLSIPGSELRKQVSAPSGIRVMLSALQNAERVVVTVGPSINGIEANLDTTCKTPDDAKVLASQLRITTATLKEAVARDRQAQNDELAMLLTAGHFDQKDRKVTGTWPVKKSLLDALTQGI
jgi:hypothetical protein